jgi:hypothetical protein
VARGVALGACEQVGASLELVASRVIDEQGLFVALPLPGVREDVPLQLFDLAMLTLNRRYHAACLRGTHAAPSFGLDDFARR